MRIHSLLRLAFCLAVAALLGACSHPAPPYQASVASIDTTSRLGAPIAVGKFGYAPGREAELNSVGARASSFTSPVNNSYADYFADAAKKELSAAGKLDPASSRVLTGVLLRNDLSAASMAELHSELQVRFRLADQDKALFEKVIESKRTGDSHFIGAIAIPRALDMYVANIQVLMRNLFGDPDFVQATQKK
jgi:hypothetical protein